MNILLTNDDGINSEGIQKLAEVLRAQGKYKVTVIAPDNNRSGISHAVSLLSGPVKVSKMGEDTWSCSGYPADCVLLALFGELSARPDLILSGINRGENMGTDLIFSGTAAAARQASLAGVPALALSLAGSGIFYWDMAVSWSVENLEELLVYWKKDTFVNVNIPNTEGGPEGMVVTGLGVKRYNDKISMMNAHDGSSWCFLDVGQELPVTEADSDSDAIFRNFVSVSSVYNYPIVK